MVVAVVRDGSAGDVDTIVEPLQPACLIENLQNVNNTPDIGVQLGVAFIPKLIRDPVSP